MITLKYKDEEDRAYALSGMALSMYVLENEKYIDYISLDAAPDEGLHLTPEFFHITTNQHLSAKAVWKHKLNRFKLLNGLMVANLFARTLVRHNARVTRDLYNLLLDHLVEEGQELCALDRDEVTELYNSTFNYFIDIFSHSAVQSIVSSVARQLIASRTLDLEALATPMRPLRRW